ncbi:hypothetical protein [Lactobacillus kefiranofaciens]|uniref:Mucus binding protein n=1 Tax=Lactobacillus kefiranofaciens TaxID=267818 RepID=A0AAX3UCD4_9LACO|nr:hypothetical protein [Lactobacillus kefiranofaciens]QFQ68810.1 hypothetical protein LKK75_11010 [Lactobacillus kefiranofaciens subsp. kefiranofaciens]WGO85305.1 hypothetical protein QEJ78_07930 [Lactobacillus kefiranofaciens]WQH35418.1 hypothetical protein U2870_07525 [Lactobacillus kefiranofaciens]SDA56705.1 hypothetical protein SAMN02983011_01378 [Lactobacillus kefiranofaciens]
MKKELEKARHKQEFDAKIFVDKMYFINKEVTPPDLPQPEGKVIKELSGSDLLFPVKNGFEKINSKEVGEIRNITYAYGNTSEVSICDGLKLDPEKDIDLTVVYIDPTFKPYIGTISISSALIRKLFKKLGLLQFLVMKINLVNKIKL